MSRRFLAIPVALLVPVWLSAQPAPRAERGAPLVDVKQAGPLWTLTGQKRTVTLDARDLSLGAQGPTAWRMLGSTAGDMRVRAAGKDVALRLADAAKIVVTPYDTGAKTGVKVELSGWPQAADLGLVLTAALEGPDEELVVDVVAQEKSASLRQLDWPGPVDGSTVDYTVLPVVRGTLLPRDWPKVFNPIRPSDTPRTESTLADSAARPAPSPTPTPNPFKDISEIQSHVIESWSMSWWGFQRGPAAMMVIVETPDDAAYQFAHPAGGPTRIGPRWRASLGRFGYLRTARFCFFEQGDYVTLAKRYRRHAQETGLFVSLREKIARSPAVKTLVGTPLTRLGILKNYKEDSFRFDKNDPTKNYSLNTFDQRAEQLRALKAKGIDRLHVCLTGWPKEGYDRQHPDELPPAPAAGGWEGMKRLAGALKDLGYLFTLHDQYRDYYIDAPSYDPQFAIHEEDAEQPPRAFPGTRFGTWKKGRIPFMNYWDGGVMGFLNSRFMLGHVKKNYETLLARGIRPDGAYLDVFGYVPPDEDWNEQHPRTRSDSMRDRAACYNWVRQRLGIVGTEAAVDWTVPYADISSPLRPARAGIPVPLFNLVYHDAILTTYNPTDLHGFLNAGVPQMGLPDLEKNLARVRQMSALSDRVALLELTKHEFLDAARRQERSTFADGTTVTVDWDKETVVIQPEVATP